MELQPNTPQFLFDDSGIAHQRRLARRWLPATVFPRPVLEPERPWEARFLTMYGSVLADPAGGWRMYYTDWAPGRGHPHVMLATSVWRGDGKMGKLELKIKVICEELPGTALLGSPASGVEVGRREIYLGIQHGDEMIEAAPATKKRIVFEPGFRVLPMPGDKANFLGPFAKGTPAQRFFYLSWAVKDGGGGLTIIGRTKVHLSHLRWSEIEESLETGKPLTVTLRLTDQRGRPRYASIRGEEASWQG